MYNKTDCVRSMYDCSVDNNEGCIGIIKPEYFTKEYRKKDYQLFRIEGGFGASPSLRGNAVSGYFCIDGERCRVEKYDFVGIADEETTKYAERLEKKWKK